MPLQEEQIKQYVPYLKKYLEGRRILKVNMYEDRAFYFDIQGTENNRFAIILDERNPRVYFGERVPRFKSLESKFFQQLKKEVDSSLILEVQQLSEDRILELKLRIINNVYKEEIRYLVVELIPLHTNLIVVDGERKIISSYRPGTIHDVRPLIRNLPYTLPNKPLRKAGGDIRPFSFSSYQEECLEKEKEIQEKRKKNLFGPLIKSVEKRIKQLERKIERLHEQITQAKGHIEDAELGNLIYTYMEEIPANSSSFEIEGQKIILDHRYSLIENAQMYFKRAKKAKETIRYCEEFLQRSKKEKEELELSFAQLIASDESGLELLAQELGVTPQSGRKGRDNLALTSSTLPYFVEYNNTHYLFGKNAKQNDCLTFLYCTARNHLWFHVMGDSGAHLIIRKDNVEESEIHFAAELTLLASNKEDGDIMYTYRKMVNKGTNPGQVKVKEFKTIHIKKISSEALSAFREAKRWIPKSMNEK